MKKLLKLLALVGIFGVALYAADDVYTVGGSAAVTGDWKVYYEDTFTTHVETLKTVVEWDKPIYNMFITSLNAAGDSGYASIEVNDVIKVPSYSDGGSHHTTSPYATYSIGDNSEADTLKLYMGIKKITITPTKGGTADSTVLLHIKGTSK